MDAIVGQVMTPEYSLGISLIAYMVSFLGSVVALWCANRMVRADGTLDKGMLASAAVALGGIGIWSMHFIGMLAYRLPVSISYDMVLTVVSLIAAILISGIALYLASGHALGRRAGWLAGSLIAGLGVCVMHYMGMFAMNLRASMSLDTVVVAVSAGIAVVAAGAALWLAFNLTRLIHQIAAAAVMGVAVFSMHFVGMTAASMVCIAQAPLNTMVFARSGEIVLGVFGIAGFVLILILWVATGRSLNGPTPIDTMRSAA